MGQHTINVLAFQEGTQWSAQCLQYDIAAQANSLPELSKAFERALAGHIFVCCELGLEPFEGLKPAPKQYWDLFNTARMKAEPEERAEFRLPPEVHRIPKPELRISEAPCLVGA